MSQPFRFIPWFPVDRFPPFITRPISGGRRGKVIGERVSYPVTDVPLDEYVKRNETADIKLFSNKSQFRSAIYIYIISRYVSMVSPWSRLHQKRTISRRELRTRVYKQITGCWPTVYLNNILIRLTDNPKDLLKAVQMRQDRIAMRIHSHWERKKCFDIYFCGTKDSFHRNKYGEIQFFICHKTNKRYICLWNNVYLYYHCYIYIFRHYNQFFL